MRRELIRQRYEHLVECDEIFADALATWEADNSPASLIRLENAVVEVFRSCRKLRAAYGLKMRVLFPKADIDPDG